jgi:iron(III) transport system ATP-binding protein
VTAPTTDGTGLLRPAVRLTGVTRSYGDVPAACGVDLAVEPGEILTVIGPSGCGKSTLLRLVAGLERPDAGAVLVAGDVMAEGSRFVPPERRRVGLVFQDSALFPHLTVRRNVAFGLAGRAHAERDRRVTEVLDLVRLGHLADRYPHELSGGEQQRVALARALAPRPAVVLLDEPFSSLDENLRAQVRADLVGILRATGVTAVLVTHDQTEALAVGDRVAVMCEGRIEQVDTPQQVFEHPRTRFVATFMGDADFLPAHVERALLTSEIGVVSTVPGWTHADDVEVVLRPHEVALSEPGRAPTATVVGVEYHGAFVLHTVQLPSGARLRSWQPHAVRWPIGAPVSVGVVPGLTPTLLVGDHAVTAPRSGQAPVENVGDEHSPGHR